jgi:hypothetical protein
MAVAAAADRTWSQHPATWNTVRRLLQFLMAEADSQSSASQQQTLPVLWVRRCDNSNDDHQSQGVVRGIRICSETTPVFGWYMDPVSFGLTLLDTALQESVEIAGRLSWTGLRDRHQAIQLSPGSLRTDESRGSPNLLLTGDSAGGLLGCGIYAMGRNELLDSRLTANWQMASGCFPV